MDVATEDRDREFASMFDSCRDAIRPITQATEGLELTDELFAEELTDVDDDFLSTGI